MKNRFIFFLLILCTLTLFCSCKKTNSLDEHVVELRSDCFTSYESDIEVKASYGFKREKTNDGYSNDKIYSLTFILPNVQSNDITYSVEFSFNGKDYNQEFKLNPIRHALTTSLNIDNFNLNEFTIKILYGSEIRDINMKSTLPENTISFSQALSHLQTQQGELLKNYCDENGNFIGYITIRVIEKNNKSYYYIGLCKDNALKALLIDGANGNVLAIRDVF